MDKKKSYTIKKLSHFVGRKDIPHWNRTRNWENAKKDLPQYECTLAMLEEDALAHVGYISEIPRKALSIEAIQRLSDDTLFRRDASKKFSTGTDLELYDYEISKLNYAISFAKETYEKLATRASTPNVSDPDVD